MKKNPVRRLFNRVLKSVQNWTEFDSIVIGDYVYTKEDVLNITKEIFEEIDFYFSYSENEAEFKDFAESYIDFWNLAISQEELEKIKARIIS